MPACVCVCVCVRRVAAVLVCVVVGFGNAFLRIYTYVCATPRTCYIYALIIVSDIIGGSSSHRHHHHRSFILRSTFHLLFPYERKAYATLLYTWVYHREGESEREVHTYVVRGNEEKRKRKERETAPIAERRQAKRTDFYYYFHSFWICSCCATHSVNKMDYSIIRHIGNE